MSVSDELYSKLNTLPWQALFEYSTRKGIKEEDIKNKDKSQIIRELDNRQLIVNAEIDKLIEEYIYGDRVTFSLWRFDENLSDADIEVIKHLEGKEIRCENSEFRKVTIQKIDQYDDRLVLIYVYSKMYHYINEQGKSAQVWEQHKGCSWIGLDKSYVAYIVKHEKMTKVFADALINEVHKQMTSIKPPLIALDRIFNDSKMSKIVLQGLDGEKTAISRSLGLTEEQKDEMNRIKKDRFNMSGSYLTSIDDKTATVRYNIKKGNIGILKHLSSKQLFKWTEGAINIIFEEIDNLKGKNATEIFEQLGLKLKWSLLSEIEQEDMNWILTQIITNIGTEQSMVIVPEEKKSILNISSLFRKILRPYCESCETYEVPLCKECGKEIQYDMQFCECGAPIQAVCQEGHALNMTKYWYIPTQNCIRMINDNLIKVYPNMNAKYTFLIMDDMLVISSFEDNIGGEILFDDIEEFKIEDFELNDELINFAVDMKEKCNGTCSYSKIETCLTGKQQICLPKLFYEIIPGFRPQPHKGGEYGDVSGTINSNGKSYEMKGIIKKNSSTSQNKRNAVLLSTSKQGEEIIRQFVEQGITDQRCELIMVVAPQYIDNSFKGTLRLLAKMSNKKVVFVELKQVCKLLRKGEIK